MQGAPFVLPNSAHILDNPLSNIYNKPEQTTK